MLVATSHPRTTAPLPLVSTRLFGRRDEIERLADMLCPREAGVRPHPRACVLATLIGPGGAGKTRLACEFGRTMANRFGGGVAYVPLAPVSSADEVVRHALQTIVLEADAKIPPVDQIAGALSGGPALLILDNAEHVVSGVADLAVRLLERLPDLRILVTSRSPVGWQGEQVVPVAPLAVPPVAGSPERMLEYPAIEMFLDRAQNIVPHFQLTVRNAEAVVAVCQRLEGLPLSIELAAARVRAAAPAEMLKELDDRFGFLVGRKRGGQKHHATLEDTISWSFERLPETHKQFLLQLSVFRGGFTREAAETVCGMESAFDLLEDLVDKSLIEGQHQDDHIRFSMLESVREFAQARMDAGERAALTGQHAAYYQAFAESQEPRLRSAASAEALTALDPEISNIRAALAATIGPTDLVQFAGAMWRYWHLRNSVQEGLEVLVRAAAVATLAPGEPCARVLLGLAMMRYRLGEISEAVKLCERAVAIARAYEVLPLLAQALNVFGVVASTAGSYTLAAERLIECADYYRTLKDSWSLASALNNLGRVERSLGDWQNALAHFEECELVYESIGSHLLAATSAGNAATIYLDRGEYRMAEMRYERSIRTMRAAGNQWPLAMGLNNLAETRLGLGDTNKARDLAQEALRIRNELGDADGICASLATLAKIEHAIGEQTRAMVILAAAEHLYSSRGISPPRPEIWERDARRIRGGWTREQLDSAQLVASGMSVNDAVRFALASDRPDSFSELSVNAIVMEAV
jgi:predicted ATPase